MNLVKVKKAKKSYLNISSDPSRTRLRIDCSGIKVQSMYSISWRNSSTVNLAPLCRCQSTIALHLSSSLITSRLSSDMISFKALPSRACANDRLRIDHLKWERTHWRHFSRSCGKFPSLAICKDEVMLVSLMLKNTICSKSIWNSLLEKKCHTPGEELSVVHCLWKSDHIVDRCCR